MALHWGYRYLMCPPEYFTVEYAINPWMDITVAVDAALAVKQWDLGRWAEVAQRLHREFHATILLTGGEGDRPIAEALARLLPFRAVDLTGRLSLRETVALLSQLDLFLSPDTGTMHAACGLIEKAGGHVVGCAFLVELLFLKGSDKLKPHEVFSLIKY